MKEMKKRIALLLLVGGTLSGCNSPQPPTWSTVSPEQRDCALRCSDTQNQCVEAAYRRYEQCILNTPKASAQTCQETTLCVTQYNACYRQCWFKKPV